MKEGLRGMSTRGVNTAWSKWQKFYRALCDEKIPRRLRQKICHPITHPSATWYGLECWPMTKKDETHANAMKTNMLRWF